MSARLHIGLGLIAILLLSGVFWWAHSLRIAPAQAEAAELDLTPTTQEINGVQYAVERIVMPPGIKSVKEGLRVAGVELNSEDRYVAVPSPSLGAGSWVEVTRALPVTIRDASTTAMYRTWVRTVGDLLAENGIELDGDDRVNPTLGTVLSNNLLIFITRVGVSDETERESIDYKTVKKSDPDLEKGKTRIGQAGKAGVRKKTFHVVRENGNIVSRDLVKNEVEREPVEEVIYEGTKVISYGSGQATWYGLRTGMQAAHNTLPFGTKVKVINIANGKSVDVVITDRGIQGSAIIDLTADAFKLIAPLGSGRIQVKLEKDYD